MIISNVLKIFKKETSELNIIQIGYTTYYIIYINEQSRFLFNKLIVKLMKLQISLYWFSTYDEFEEYFTYFDNNLKNIFIIIY